jgi:hypothetical protein
VPIMIKSAKLRSGRLTGVIRRVVLIFEKFISKSHVSLSRGIPVFKSS